MGACPFFGGGGMLRAGRGGGAYGIIFFCANGALIFIGFFCRQVVDWLFLSFCTGCALISLGFFCAGC